MPETLTFDNLTVAVALVLAAAGVVLLAGPRMVAVADRLADVTGLGEALAGAVLLGAATSLPDVAATVTPAWRGLPDLAVGNALGGVLGQTAFLAVADLTYRRANLEHAAASLPNLVQGTVLLTLLSVVLVLLNGPQVDVLGVHPATVVLVPLYLYGIHLTNESLNRPMWRAVATPETRPDEPDEPPAAGERLRSLVLRFAALGIVLGVAGWALGRSGEAIAAATGLSETGAGMVLTGLTSSLAELVVSVAAVRSGALTLAVGNVIGGNTFDTLLVGVADLAYREGSVYAAVGAEQTFLTGMALLATAVITLGLLRRERHGIGNIGMESAVVLALYLTAAVVIV